MRKREIQDRIIDLARSHGIDVIGFTHASEFKGYLMKGSKRQDPRNAMPDAETILVAGIYIGGCVLPSWDKPGIGRTSRLYLSGFFSDVTRQVEPLARFLRSQGYQALICDTSRPGGSIIPLKLAAVRAGLGWQGKHSLLISRQFGTFLALGGIITNADLKESIKEETDLCMNCSECQKACPLNALEKDYVLNKEKCLSYILQQEKIPDSAKPVLGNRIVDCEICQEHCPWNKKHINRPMRTGLTEDFSKKISTWQDFFSLPDLVKLTQSEYRNKLGHLNTGIPYSIFNRNVLLAANRWNSSC